MSENKASRISRKPVRSVRSRRCASGSAAVLAAAVAGLSPVATFAASTTWLNTGTTSANWNTASNWVSGAAPGAIVAITGSNANADIATFDTALGSYGTSATPIVIDSALQNFAGITFDAAAGKYFVGTTGGNKLYLSSGGAIQITNTLSNAASAVVTETVNAPLIIEGANGTYSLTNNSANGTAAKAGILNFGGAIGGGKAGATVLTLDGSNTNTNTISGVISNGTATTLSVAKNGTGTWYLSNINTYTGTTTINGGILEIDTNYGPTGGGAGVTIDTGGTLNFGGAGAATVSTVTLINGSIGGVSSILTATSFDVRKGTVSARLGGTGTTTLTKSTADTVTFSGNNNNVYSGLTSVSAGELDLAKTGSKTAIAGNVSITGGKIKLLGNEQIADTSTLTVNGASAIFDLDASHAEKVNTVTLDGGGSITGTGSSALTSAGTFEMKSGSASAILAGAGIALNKTTSGIVTLSGVNTYSGATSVKAGTLIVSGSLASSAVTVGDSANLSVAAILAGGTGGGGNGGAVGAVTLGAALGNSGASISPGNGAGVGTGTTLNTGAFAITAGSGSHLNMQIGRSTSGFGTAGDKSDHINVTGSVSLDGDLGLSLLTGTGYTSVNGDTLYLVVNDGLDAVVGKFASINGNNNGGIGWAEGSTFSLNSKTWAITYQANYEGGLSSGGNDVALLVVPEPTGMSVLAMGGIALLRRRRRI